TREGFAGREKATRMKMLFLSLESNLGQEASIPWTGDDCQQDGVSHSAYTAWSGWVRWRLWTFRAARLQHREIPLHLVRSHDRLVAIPLLAFVADQELMDVVSEHIPKDGR